jgi:predicted TIM-barrel fold metal-dependent hydrolase
VSSIGFEEETMAIAVEPKTRPMIRRRRRAKTAVIDCDIHNALPSDEAIRKYLPQRWRNHHRLIGLRGHNGCEYPRASPNAARHDSWPPSGLPAGSDLDFLREQLLDEWDLEYGLLNCLVGAGRQQNLEFGAAFAQGLNDWQIEAWLEPEPRLRASIVVPYEDGELSAAEIDRVGGHPGFVQVLAAVRTQQPLGRRKYWKMYEACERHDLPFGIHFGGNSGQPLTGGGWPNHYYEDHAGMPQAFQAQMISMVTEGVFERFPGLKVVLIEGGFAWLPPLMWRLDRSWGRLKEEVPDLRRLPSETIRRHFWLTTQPMEEPPRHEYLVQLLEQLDMDDRLLFATDYPHWDFDSPAQAIPPSLPREFRRAIMSENARSLYDFGEA